jgi:hypothetical protein
MLKINSSREPEFQAWLDQFLARLYLPPDKTPDYQSPFPREPTGELPNTIP